jgi:hypothetical protein
MSLAIACSGGGNWTVSQLGFIQALLERGYSVRAASGVSFGSFSAFAAVTGTPWGAMARIRRFGELVNANLARSWEGVLNSRRLVTRIEGALQAVLPERAVTSGELYLMAVRVPSFAPVTFTKADSLPRVLRAAMAMPPLPAAQVNGSSLRDAGLRMKYGIRALVGGGYRRILCLGAFPDGFSTRWPLWRRVVPAYREVEAHEVVLSGMSKIGLAEFTRRAYPVLEDIFHDGYRAGKRYSARILDSLMGGG